jgi:chromosome partitioning protein
MAKIITITNQKGGVAKTTTTGALAAGLKARGYNVLAIDLDHKEIYQAVSALTLLNVLRYMKCC